MKILFVYSSLPLGGIETFLVRLCNRLKERNIGVKIIFFSSKGFNISLLADLRKSAEVYFWDEFSFCNKIFSKLPLLIKILVPLKVIKSKTNLLSDITHIHAPDTYSIYFAKKLIRLKHDIILTTGVYHINEFNIQKFSSFYFGKQLLLFFKNLPYKNILFFNEISREMYFKKLNTNFLESKIAPIGIEIQGDENEIIGSQNNRIVSVGRLTEWKKYNFHMINVIKKLNKEGYNLKYDCYGDGSERSHLEKLVKLNALQDHVFFHNSIEYHLFKQTIGNSLVFVGAGTALIEASALGIPALIGIENEDREITFGFLHNTNSYSYQERELSFPVFEITERIKYLLAINKQQYVTECINAKQRAQDFSMEKSTQIFIEFIKQSENFVYPNKWILDLLFIKSLFAHFIICKLKGNTQQSFFKRL